MLSEKKKKKKGVVRDEQNISQCWKVLAEDTKILNVNAYNSNSRASTYTKQNREKLKEEKTNPQTQDQNSTSLYLTDRTNRGQNRMHVGRYKTMINQLDLINRHRKSHPTTAECIFFFKDDSLFSKIDDMLGHRPSLIKFLRIMITKKLNYKPTTEKKLWNSQIFGNLKKQISK